MRDRQNVGGAGEGEEHRDRLLAYLGTSQFASMVRQKIETDGYVVLPSIFTCAWSNARKPGDISLMQILPSLTIATPVAVAYRPNECDAEYERMWTFIEKIEPSIQRDKPETWQRRSPDDPWPCAQRDMFQMYQAGWLFTNLRVRPFD